LSRNPVLSRQTQQQLKSVQNIITIRPQEFLDDAAALQQLAEEHNVRILIFNTARQLLLDTNQAAGSLPFPRRNLLNRTSQTAIDSSGRVWLYSFARVGAGRVL